MSLLVLQSRPLSPLMPVPSKIPGMVGSRLHGTNGSLLQQLRKLPGANAGQVSFRAQLEIPGAPVVLPEQEFICSFTGSRVVLENHPRNNWPRILIEWQENPATGLPKTLRSGLQVSTPTVDGHIAYTRVWYFLAQAGIGLFHVVGDNLTLKWDNIHLSDTDYSTIVYHAGLVRKLKYIENVFKVRFTLPTEIQADQISTIDLLFRGITEGEFTRRMPGIALTTPSAEIDLSKPPFNGPGIWFKSDDGRFELFGQNFSAGLVNVKLEQAELADPQLARQIKTNYSTTVKVRFDLLDHQATFRFENFVKLPKEQLVQQLGQFKKELSRDDPLELVELMLKPLTLDVSAAEADLIAVGWMQYNHLPDRYCTQEPVLDTSKNAWRVPIRFGYPTGQSGEVGELLIDVKTGKVVSHTSIEQLREQGKSLAKAFLHAS